MHWGKQNIFIQFVRGGDHPHIHLRHVYMNFSYEKHNQEDSGGVQDKQPEQNISYFGEALNLRTPLTKMKISNGEEILEN